MMASKQRRTNSLDGQSSLGETLKVLEGTDVEGPFVCLNCGSAGLRWFACENECKDGVVALSEGPTLNRQAIKKFGCDLVEAYLERYLETTIRRRKRSCVNGPLQVPSLRALAMLALPLEYTEPMCSFGSDKKDELAEQDEILHLLDRARTVRNAKFVRRCRPLDRVPRETLRSIATFSDVPTMLAMERTSSRLNTACRTAWRDIFRAAGLAKFAVLRAQCAYFKADTDFRETYRRHLTLSRPRLRFEPAPPLEPTTTLDDYLFTVQLTGMLDSPQHYVQGVVRCIAQHDIDEDFVVARLPRDLATALAFTVNISDYPIPVALRVDCLRKATGQHVVLYEDGRVEDVIGDELFFESQDIPTRPSPTSCAFVEHVPGGRSYELGSEHIVQPAITCFFNGTHLVIRFHSDTMDDRDDMPLAAILVLLEHDVPFE